MIASFLVASLLAAAPARAWNREGHRAAAELAERRLSPAARRKVAAILGAKHGLADVSACSDEIKRRAVRCGSFDAPVDRRSGRWHYIDIPLGAEPRAGDLKRFCGSHGRADQCVTEQIRLHLRVLADETASLRLRQLALMHAVHLVVDLHQPLHAADDEDAGGNRKLVRVGRRKTNLHQLWDGLYDGSPLEPVADVKAWLQGDLVDAAALESFALAKSAAYGPWKAQKGLFDGGYRARQAPAAKRRLQAAGVRLAELLERALSPSGA